MPLFVVAGLAVAVVVFVDSPGPLFYRARRIGRHGKPFWMWKFRKMVEHAQGPALTSAGDERLTPVGRFLTASRLDELPQVWNVLKGEMRLVGPRPEVQEFVQCYPEAYAEILTVMPGLTGLSQLRHVQEGQLFADGADDPHVFYRDRILPRKIDLDLAYVRDHSVATDLRILASTLVLPFRLAWRRAVALRLELGRTYYAWSVVAGSAVALVVLFAAQAGSIR